MLFHPCELTPTEGCFVFSGCLQATANPCLNKAVFEEFWRNFTFQASTVTFQETPARILSIGNAQPLPLNGYDYSIHITPDGICVYAEGDADLIHGVMTLLDRFTAIDRDGSTAVSVECCQIRDRAMIRNRMIHFCIFAETELWELQRFVRLCGALKYTHVVLEFWGMLKLDCMKELSWPHGFTKDQIKPIIQEANELGMEVIPMFNHWGHAPAGRVMHGKHVVLDQNPSLQPYFSEDGWCWDIRKPKVKDLLRQVRCELMELCGNGSYFHIGCDEAYNFEFTKENMVFLSDFINEICEEMTALGRRILVWGDMFLYRYRHYNPNSRYTCNAPTPEVEQFFLNHLSKRIIIADWQYRAYEAPVETCAVFQKAGFDCILCPWDEGKAQIDAALTTIKDQALMGYMHTTWHTLTRGMQYVTLMGMGGFENVEAYKMITMNTYTAALLRKVMPAGGVYEKAGWGRFDVGCKW